MTSGSVMPMQSVIDPIDKIVKLNKSGNDDNIRDYFNHNILTSIRVYC